MVAATRDASELKMLPWAEHLMKMHSCNVTASDPVTAQVRPESPSRRVAHFSRFAKSRVAAPRLGATRPTLPERPDSERNQKNKLGFSHRVSNCSAQTCPRRDYLLQIRDRDMLCGRGARRCFKLIWKNR